MEVKKKPEEEENELVSELKRQLENEHLTPVEKLRLLNDGLNNALNSAAVHVNSGELARLKSQLYLSGVLIHCIHVLSLHPSSLWGDLSAAATLAHLTSSCCVGVEPGPHSETFHRLFLPSVVDALLSLAAQLVNRAENVSLFRKVMDSVGWLLAAHTHLTEKVLSSIHYEQIQVCDDVNVSLLCVQMWIQTCTANSDFLSGLSDDSILLLLNEAIGQLALSSDSTVGGASVRLILLMASQLGRCLRPLLLSFRGLDSLLHKDWRGRGFDRGIDQLIALIQSEKNVVSQSQGSSEHVRAACVIQAAWRSYKTRRRVKSLNRAVSVLQRKYRARRKEQQQQKEAQLWEEELKYQVCVRRQQARRRFHQKQRQLLQLLPADQVQTYLQECENRAAVVIQSFWRGFRERRHYSSTQRHMLRRERAVRTLQRGVHTHTSVKLYISAAGYCLLRLLFCFFQVRRFLQKRRAAKVPPLPPFWIGQKGLTDSRRAELNRQVDEYIATHQSFRVSPEECSCLHEEVQLLLLSVLQTGAQQRMEEQRVEALLAHVHTQLELLRDAPPLSVVTETDADTFLSPSGPVAARARDAHNAILQASRLPWWRTLGDTDAGHVNPLGSTHVPELEEELGGLYIGGTVADKKQTQVDEVKL
ncbi:IQ calmodulin-binding motif-containing protein 1 isoform X1 [Oreochromis aureus]|uniref:IQ motif containing B1 n=1 Tax=Oreochromis aureus TaxID=47969 RepID=A0AAZ1XB41_OREAU|nr:IQ calmodulin-binding motif-containing protein 1 isoform X1 [Oreochromis aureus]